VRALPGEAVIANRDFVSPPLPLADQPGCALQLRAASYSGLSDFLQIPSDLGKLAGTLGADRPAQLLAFDMRLLGSAARG
jgi:hypothetical protein